MFSASKTKQVSSAANYIEDVFSTYLYTGTNASKTITNGIDLAGKGGLVWIKDRTAANDHLLYDTVRGAGSMLSTDSTGAAVSYSTAYDLASFTSTGFTLGANGYGANVNNDNEASWTFRKQPKFFDVVTYTGNGVQATTTGSATNWDRTIAHSLASQPGFIIIKRTDSTGDWLASGRRDGSYGGKSLYLNTTAAAYGGNDQLDSFSTTTTFSPGSFRDTSSNFNYWNINGATYVAYIFAHNAGGFGLTGTDNVISCGSYTGNGTSQNINLGYEPQFLMVKNTTTAGTNWFMFDNMRGLSATNQPAYLYANSANSEGASGPDLMGINATGFIPFGSNAGTNASGSTYIYIAIRRGPMKVPTDATKVFVPTTWAGNGNTGLTVTSLTSPTDLAIMSARNAQNPKLLFSDRLRGSGTGENSGNMKTLTSTSNTYESSSALNGYYATLDYQNSVRLLGSSTGIYNSGGVNYLLYSFKRAPSFFDEVCYTGAGTTTTFNHNLGAVPEMIIFKCRQTANWCVYAAPSGQGYFLFNYSDPFQADTTTFMNNTTPTSTVFTVGTDVGQSNPNVNSSGSTYVAYLFASCAGVSKIGTYTGTGATQTINCGFAAGARFVMIKRTNGLGDWYVWDTARGMVSGTDPYLLLDTTDAEVNANNVYTASTGFQIVGTGTGINASGSTYIYLAIA